MGGCPSTSTPSTDGPLGLPLDLAEMLIALGVTEFPAAIVSALGHPGRTDMSVARIDPAGIRRSGAEQADPPARTAHHDVVGVPVAAVVRTAPLIVFCGVAASTLGIAAAFFQNTFLASRG